MLFTLFKTSCPYVSYRICIVYFPKEQKETTSFAKKCFEESWTNFQLCVFKHIVLSYRKKIHTTIMQITSKPILLNHHVLIMICRWWNSHESKLQFCLKILRNKLQFWKFMRLWTATLIAVILFIRRNMYRYSVIVNALHLCIFSL